MTVMKGVYWLEHLRSQMTAGLQRDGVLQKSTGILSPKAAYAQFLRMLDDPETKRLLFDSRQAVLFDDLDEVVPGNIQRKLHVPFNQFYMELTEPVIVGAQEPGWEGRETLHAFLYTDNIVDVDIHHQWPDEEEPRIERYSCGQLTLFFQADDGALTDRTFCFNLDTGLAFTRPKTCVVGEEDPSEMPPDWLEWPDEAYIVAGHPAIGMSEDRHIGWWERAICGYASLFSWILAYTMAKSIKVEIIPMSRPQRRWHERKNKIPKPWHVIKVDPKFVTKAIGEPGIGVHHSYRYDVIGHLRFGKHKLGDGSYRDTIEWVIPHQRGLANSVYIPATHKISRGKVVAPAMRRYYGEGAEKVGTKEGDRK